MSGFDEASKTIASGAIVQFYEDFLVPRLSGDGLTVNPTPSNNDIFYKLIEGIVQYVYDGVKQEILDHLIVATDIIVPTTPFNGSATGTVTFN